MEDAEDVEPCEEVTLPASPRLLVLLLWGWR